MKTPYAIAFVMFLLVPGIGWAQPAVPAPPPAAVEPVENILWSPTKPGRPDVYTTCNGGTNRETPVVPDADAAPDTPVPEGHHCNWPEVWGNLGMPLYLTGSHMGANGNSFYPLFAVDFDFNVGLLPHKELYLFVDSQFWGQKAAPGVTNPSQGKFDFSKREYDVTVGLAWNYYDHFELRGEAYALNNLNRGDSLTSPYGFKDGVGIENRYYFGSADIYDVGKLSFVSLGYYPTKALVGGDGSLFKPGLFARAYLVPIEIPQFHSYVYFDGQYDGERVVKPRLLEMDVGVAARPFDKMPNLEFRIGYDVTGDVQADTTRNLVYGAVRINY